VRFRANVTASVAAGFILFCLSSFTVSTAHAQEGRRPAERDGALPDAPGTQETAVQPGENEDQRTGNVSGTVLDTNKNVVPGAHVTLAGSSATVVGTVESGDNGQFAFRGLLPGLYKVTVTGPGMSSYTSPQFSLHAGDAYILPTVTLPVSAAITNVTVRESKEELAEEQVRIAVQQRVAGVIPNFYTTYDWNAPPMGAKQKLKLSFRSMIDPVSFATVAGIAGAEQYKNIFPAYGGGLEGYGERYGAALANHVTGSVLARGVYPSIFHQDPRYFYKGKGSIRSRALYAMSAAVIAKGDDGRWKPNYPHVLGDLSAGAISNLYYPPSSRGAALVFLNGLTDTAANAVSNLIREFLLKEITTNVPKSANGEP
jgi:Carboxypeptidase regulatory-like domain